MQRYGEAGHTQFQSHQTMPVCERCTTKSIWKPAPLPKSNDASSVVPVPVPPADGITTAPTSALNATAR